MFLGVTVILNAGSTGTIEGTLTDSNTGDPIIGASVLIVGTKLGAVTDIDGEFVIYNAPSGQTTLRISHIEYQTRDTVIYVKAKQTVELGTSLIKKEAVLDDKIVVTAEADINDRFGPQSQVTLSKEASKKKPVTTVDELLDQVADAVQSNSGKVIIRGGRAGETSCIVDGVPSTEPTPPLAPVPPRRTPVYQPPPYHDYIDYGAQFDDMYFKNHGVNPFVDTKEDHLSTFAIDVDDASYILTRSYLERGSLPPEDAVRVEEFINHFEYDYEAPDDRLFTVYMEGVPSRFGNNSQLLRIGIKGKDVSNRDRQPANLVFVIDVSGSMDREDRLELVKKGLRFMVDKLRSNDRVGIVVYGSDARVVLEPTAIRNRRDILSAIDELYPEGSTNAQAGLRLGFKMANRQFDSRRINRVILCSDGVANVGVTNPDQLLREITRYADKGITLTTIGFGMGNYNDELMERLGDRGNGSYAYVDDLSEARRVFVENLTGMLQVIARDVKIQVDFNPEVVAGYRLLGYENRNVADRDFRNDRVDGGEIGAGHQVTALYEINFQRYASRQPIGKVFVRYKDPTGEEVDELRFGISGKVFQSSFNYASTDTRLAAVAAEFAEIMRGSYFSRGTQLNEVLALANEVYNDTGREDVLELMNLISKSIQLDQLARY
jgi:Ca-activated chloride channel family protein